MGEQADERELPQYVSHKKVWALEIGMIDAVLNGPGENHFSLIYPADTRYAPIKVDFEYMNKHNPKAGGYYVVYADGYKSWSPAKAFEEGYTLVE